MSEWPPPVTSPDPEKQKARHILIGMTEKAADAISFDRLLIGGLLMSLGMILLLAAVIVYYKGTDDQRALVLGFYKDLALILAGALANSVRHGQRERKDDQ